MLRTIVRVAAGLVLLPPLFLYVAAFAMIPGNAYVGVPGDAASSAMLKQPPPAWGAPVTLRVVTFNIQNLPLVARNHVPRMEAIAKKLGELDPDLVGFQESFVDEHRAILEEELIAHTRLRHFAYYPSGTVGSGVYTASAHPIAESYFHRYAASNPWWKIWEGDWWAGKGIGLARVRLANGAALDFFNTHAQAGYGNPYYDVVRERQMVEAAAFVNNARLDTAPALLVGDLNCRPGDADFEALARGADLERLSAAEGRIDHILGVKDAQFAVESIETIKIDEDNVVDGKPITLSDHDGWLCVIRIAPTAPPPAAATLEPAAEPATASPQ